MLKSILVIIHLKSILIQTTQTTSIRITFVLMYLNIYQLRTSHLTEIHSAKIKLNSLYRSTKHTLNQNIRKLKINIKCLTSNVGFFPSKVRLIIMKCISTRMAVFEI